VCACVNYVVCTMCFVTLHILTNKMHKLKSDHKTLYILSTNCYMFLFELVFKLSVFCDKFYCVINCAIFCIEYGVECGVCVCGVWCVWCGGVVVSCSVVCDV